MMGDFLGFEMMITPVLIQILFWLAVAVSVIGVIGRFVQNRTLTPIRARLGVPAASTTRG
jgi:hypothetical protein